MVWPMHPNEELITGFYEAFADGTYLTMEHAYADNARFSDPVFPDLSAAEVRAMWRMFCTSGNEIKVTFSDVKADDTTGSAHWEAVYAFPKPGGRTVHNVIEARFEFADNTIVRHVDSFDLNKWTRMALGPVGVLLGWTPMVKKKVRAQAAARLDSFRAGGHGSA